MPLGIHSLAAFFQHELFWENIYLSNLLNTSKTPTNPLNLAAYTYSYYLNRGVIFLRFLILGVRLD
jgi:hypothetical protein